MKLGIVGHAAEKFTKRTEHMARVVISKAIAHYDPECVVSGGSPMGGVDIWAEEHAKMMGYKMQVHAPNPNNHRWDGPGGFKERNLEIAAESDVVLCIVVKDFPPGFDGKRFPYCYHCKEERPPHIKSGGCWTAMRAPEGIWRIIE
jgi:hypothetical protein